MEDPKTGELVKLNRIFTKSNTATPEQIGEVNRARKAHVKGALAEIGNVDSIFTAHVIRDHQHSTRDLAAGAKIIADAAKHREDQANITTRAKRQKKADDAAEREALAEIEEYNRNTTLTEGKPK